jgi:DNA polymerase-1
MASIGFFFLFPEESWPQACSPLTLNTRIFPYSPIRVRCKGWEDTLPASHIDSSKGTHKLKELGLLHLDYPETDEEKLLTAVKKAVDGIAKKKKFNLSRKYAGKNEDGSDKTDPEYEADYWVLKALDRKNTLCRQYANGDTERTLLLWMLRYNKLFEQDVNARLCYEREKKVIPVVYAIENHGITISKHRLEYYLTKLKNESEPNREHAAKIACKTLKVKSFNTNSYPQLREILYSKKGFNFPVLEYTDKENPSTSIGSDEVPGPLIKLRNDYCDNKPTAKKFLQHLIISKKYATGVNYLSNYKRAIQQHWDNARWVLYPTLNPNGTDTTRFSSFNPNAQNISKRAETPLRNIFCPPKGRIWFAIDYQQLQLRIFAFVTQAQVLIDAFRAGHDFHATVATGIFKKALKEITKLERRIAKNTNFALIFGATKKKVNKTAGIDNAYERFEKQFPMVTAFLNKAIRQVRSTGGIVTPFGYPLEVDHNKPYAGANYIIQGCEGDIVKNAMILLVHTGLIDFKDYSLILQVHDELLIEAPEKYSRTRIRKIMGIMEFCGTLLDMETPVEAEIITTHWGKGSKIKLKPIRPNLKQCKKIIYGLAV